MKRRKFIVCLIVMLGLMLSMSNWSVLFASSCCGSGAGHKSHDQQGLHAEEENKSYSGTISKVEIPLEMSAEGILTGPGYFLLKNRKGLCYDDKNSRISAVYIEKVAGCEKSGKEDCPYENKLYHILYNKESKKLIENTGYQNRKVSLTGRFYPDERTFEVVSFNLMGTGEIPVKEYSGNKLVIKEEPDSKETAVYKCPMHPEVTSDKPDRCNKCGMKLKK